MAVHMRARSGGGPGRAGLLHPLARARLVVLDHSNLQQVWGPQQAMSGLAKYPPVCNIHFWQQVCQENSSVKQQPLLMSLKASAGSSPDKVGLQYHLAYVWIRCGAGKAGLLYRIRWHVQNPVVQARHKTCQFT